MTAPQLLRFFFHIVGDGRSHPDEQGDVFDAVEAANNHAVRIAYELRHDAYQGCEVRVLDAAGTEVARGPIGGPAEG